MPEDRKKGFAGLIAAAASKYRTPSPVASSSKKRTPTPPVVSSSSGKRTSPSSRAQQAGHTTADRSSIPLEHPRPQRTTKVQNLEDDKVEAAYKQEEKEKLRKKFMAYLNRDRAS